MHLMQPNEDLLKPDYLFKGKGKETLDEAVSSQ